MTESVRKFEQELATFTGAPYVVTTDCCTHAIELCFRLLQMINDSWLIDSSDLSVVGD